MSKARIMIVEDEGVVALQIRESLEAMGYAVPLVALTGEEAVDKLLETEPDLILMDIKLTGGLSGI
ncbi:MAG: response regulator [Spirochaetia bacterium]